MLSQPDQIRMLAPAAALALWTLAMMVWMTVTRGRGMAKAGITPDKVPVGMRGDYLDPRLEPRFMWQGHNYNHLLEQPTLFYPMALALALLGPTGLDLGLAWSYVGLRVLHSFWQSLVNTVPVRFFIFLLATIVLATMATRVLLGALNAG